ncbi:MAG: hypothetical protein PHR77_06045 [Kiritimatiellae bacterium]|nr:hypothetical protein [Kiritimatiellia bacterium]MDD5520496.1 hypothetical protein [Kiritimatiellia bacterium]
MKILLFQKVHAIGVIFFLVCFSVLSAEKEPAEPSIKIPQSSIKHRFLLEDESRFQVVYVDQNDPSKTWAITFPGRYRDYQLIGGNKIILSTGEGYREYSMDTKQMTKEVKGFPGTRFARRRNNGTTVIGGDVKDGVEITELDSQDRILRKANFKCGSIRLGRFTPQGTLLFGSGDRLVEGTLDGRIVKDLKVEGCKNVYQALRRPDDHLLVATGYSSDLVELDAEGKVLKRFGGMSAPEARDLGYHFFSGFQVLKNGNIVVSNWSGHAPKDSEKGVQLVEFNPEGKLVWAWHDAQIAGSIHGVIILDDIDCSVLNDDISSVLGPVLK